ncbi:putative glycosyltransferase [Fulvivirga imtechensis AK7]|uniref:Putative glycosyltransferase n=1 Tax=Fulvivirga imtechensis AK7 TaxID=1237149 RepID=L8JVL7_9BACT|nr:glycosyltransferase family 4 protein [Fulvivirga imtechensis]ELR71262.1 putative glycosyltransferase [Fulvivirga imtechensis AK7]
MAKPRILIVDSSRAFTGAFNSILNFCEGLRDDYDFHFALPKHSSNISLIRERYTYQEFQFIDISMNAKALLFLPYLVSNSLKLKRYIKSNGIDIVHVNDIINLAGVGAKFFGARVPLVYHIRLMPDSYFARLYPLFFRVIYAYADRIICVSDAVKKKLGRSNKIIRIYNAFNFKEATLKRSRVIDKEKVTLLYLANYTPGKGHDAALRAFAKAFQTNSKMKLIFTGGCMGLKKNELYLCNLEKLAEELHIKDKVVFRAFSSDIESLFAEADIFLNFSVSESFSRTCLEAQYFGVPVIATNCGGPAEIIQDQHSGLLVPVGDIDKMAEAIIKLTTNPGLRVKFASGGKQIVENKFSYKTTIMQLNRLYQDLL